MVRGLPENYFFFFSPPTQVSNISSERSEKGYIGKYGHYEGNTFLYNKKREVIT